MEEHNREAYLSTYEKYPSLKDSSVLIAYGRLLTINEDANHINAIADCLKLYDGEYLKAKLDRETFVALSRK